MFLTFKPFCPLKVFYKSFLNAVYGIMCLYRYRFVQTFKRMSLGDVRGEDMTFMIMINNFLLRNELFRRTDWQK